MKTLRFGGADPLSIHYRCQVTRVRLAESDPGTESLAIHPTNELAMENSDSRTSAIVDSSAALTVGRSAEGHWQNSRREFV